MNRIIKIILHLFYWVVFCLFSGVVSYRLSDGFDFIARNAVPFLFNLAWAVLVFYAFYFFFYRLIEKQRYIRYIFLSLVVSIVISVTLTLLFILLFHVHTSYELSVFLPQTVGTLIIGQTGSLLRGFIRWFEDIQHKQEVDQLILRTELDMLNAQLNPHFLFNTLNNIDSLIRSNPEKASESLITLSEIMRYMLYEAKKPMVKLKDEIAHYRNILRLQTLRLKDSSKVQFSVEIENEEIQLAPLLFLPFLENVFRYTTFDAPEAFVDIRLTSTGHRVEFRCSNSFRKEDVAAKSKEGGIGLTNLKRRLELLYAGKYQLTLNQEDACFTVQLILETE
ncbi:MAG: histidine kinase [Bacteroidales bacterium]|nr:histidine kinase [Bacteroidales bacterium]MDD3908049.1 histidine kinase [Bacteroidales bacterium]MDD4712146.1 histidine kinase [Bacteroidales bacterium]